MRYGEGRGKALAPGMIGGRLVRSGWGLKGLVELFGVNNVRLPGLLMEDGVLERLVLVEDGEVFVEVQTDGNRGVTHSIGGALGLDLIDDLVELDSEVFGEDTCLLPGQDMSEIVLCGKGTMGIEGTAWLFGKSPVEAVDKGW